MYSRAFSLHVSSSHASRLFADQACQRWQAVCEMWSRYRTHRWKGLGRVQVRFGCQNVCGRATHGSHSLVDGHRSALAFGLLGDGDGIPVVAMLGRVRNMRKSLTAFLTRA